MSVRALHIRKYVSLVFIVCLAGNYGTRKRGGGVSTLICAVMDDQSLDDDDIWCVVFPSKLSEKELCFPVIGPSYELAQGYLSRTMFGYVPSLGRHGIISPLRVS